MRNISGRKIFGGMVCGVSVVLLSFALNAAPPKQRTIAEWAEQERVVSADSGSRFPGPWSNSRAPYGVEIMEACGPADPSIIIAIRGSAQSAKSEFAMNAIGHTIQDAPKGILAVLPSGDEASKYSELKLDPMFKASPGLARCVYNTSSASRGKIGRKPFRNGFIQITTAGSDMGLQMLTVGLVVTEELGSWDEKKLSDKKKHQKQADRGDPFEQTQARRHQQESERRHMLITLTKMFVRDVLKSHPKGCRRAKTWRDISRGYTTLAYKGGELIRLFNQKAAKYTELASRLDGNAVQASPDPIHQHQL